MNDDTEPQSAPNVFSPRLVFPAAALARVPPYLKPDQLLKASIRDEPIVLDLLFPMNDDAERGDTLQLTVDGRLVGEAMALDLYEPGDTLHLVLAAADRPFSLVEDRRVVRINYEVHYGSGSGGNEYGPDDQTFVTDVVRPGRDSLAALVFDPRVVAYGVTPEFLVDDGAGNRYLPAIVKGYATAAAGDWIQGRVDDALVTPTREVAIADVGNDIELAIPESVLMRIDGDMHSFSYLVTDRAGNVSQLGQLVPLDVRLSEWTLEEPAVPTYDDDDPGDELVDEKDARSNLEVVIPTRSTIHVGDEIQVYWGPATAPRMRVENPSDIRVSLSYALVQVAWLDSNASGDDVEVATAVQYEVYRRGVRLGTSPVHGVVVNLHNAGGADPDPVTDPNENLLAPVLRPASGAANDDRIPVGDSTQPATVRIDKLGASGKAIVQPDDRIVVHYADQVLAAYVIDATDLDDIAVPLEITLPADTIAFVGAGTQVLSYWIERDLAYGGFNTAKSPLKNIEVVTAGALPGEGSLVAVQMPEVLAGKIGLGALLDGTPIAVPEYANFSPDDDIVIYVPIFPYQHQPIETPVADYGAADGDADQGNRFELPKPHVMLPAEVGNVAEPGDGDTKPIRGPIPVRHVFFRLPADRIPGLHGTTSYHTHVTCRVSNPIGSVTSAARSVIIDPRGTLQRSAGSATSQDAEKGAVHDPENGGSTPRQR